MWRVGNHTRLGFVFEKCVIMRCSDEKCGERRRAFSPIQTIKEMFCKKGTHRLSWMDVGNEGSSLREPVDLKRFKNKITIK